MAEIRTVRLPDYSMNCIRFGDGSRTLVILPGLSVGSVLASADAIEEAYASMTEDYTVFLFDRRNELPPVYPVAEMARDTASVMRELGISGADVFGASQGGMIAMEIALNASELCRRLALGSTAARIGDEESKRLGKWVELARSGDAEGLYLSFAEAVYPAEVFSAVRDSLQAAAELVTEGDLDRFAVLAEGTRGFDVTDRLPSVRCPVLLLDSADDRVLGPGAGERIAALLGDRPDFKRHWYDGYGHAAYDTAPDYKERLLAFFRQETGGDPVLLRRVRQTNGD